MAEAAPPVEQAQVGEEDEDIDGEWDGDYEEEEEEDDEILAAAQRLQEKLWEDIKANAADSTPPAAPAAEPEPSPLPVTPSEPLSNPKIQAAIATVRAILASLERDALAKSTLETSKMPDFAGDTLLAILENISVSETIPRGVALPISRFLVTLAKSETLFGSLRHSDAPALQLKRKREEAGVPEHASKRLNVPTHPLHQEIADAVRLISHTVTTSTPSTIASIQPHLHAVFLFAVSASTAAGPSKNALQEISGLIQVLGVLSGIQIGQNSSAPGQQDAAVPTAVHPCLVAGCGKVFARLVDLRAHAPVHAQKPTDAKEEEGEISAAVIAGTQETVLSLHAPLQAYVARALGQAPLVRTANAREGQATLASVIAREQMRGTGAGDAQNASPTPSLSMYGLSDAQAKLLQVAVANAATAAHAQAALEEGGDAAQIKTEISN